MGLPDGAPSGLEGSVKEQELASLFQRNREWAKSMTDRDPEFFSRHELEIVSSLKRQMD